MQVNFQKDNKRKLHILVPCTKPGNMVLFGHKKACQRRSKSLKILGKSYIKTRNVLSGLKVLLFLNCFYYLYPKFLWRILNPFRILWFSCDISRQIRSICFLIHVSIWIRRLNLRHLDVQNSRHRSKYPP